MGGELERVDVRKEDFYADKEGQLSFLDPDVVNYFPTASDYGRIPNRFIERYSSISYLANLGLMAAIQNVTLRDARNYEGTREGELYKKIAKKGKANFAEGLVSCIPVSQFLKIYGLSTGGHNYSTLQELYNGHLMANQWNIIYEDKEIISWMAVVVATAYVKETGSLYVKFNSDLQDVLLNLKRDYATISLPVLGKLKEDFVTSMYQLFKKRLDYEMSKNMKFYNSTPDEICLDFNLNEFYFLIGMYPVDMMSDDPAMVRVVNCLKVAQYDAAAAIIKESGLLDRAGCDHTKANAVKDFRKFKSRFLDKAFKRINGFDCPKGLDAAGKKKEPALKEYEEMCKLVHPTDIHFRYETCRSGQGGRVGGIKIFVSKADWTENEQSKASDSDVIENYSIEQIQVIVEVKQLAPAPLSIQDSIAVAIAAEWDMEKIKKACAAAKAYASPINNITGFLIEAIRKDYPVTEIAAEAVEEELYPMAVVKSRLGYDSIIGQRPDLARAADIYFDIIYDTLNSEAPKIRAGSSMLNAEVIKERLLELQPEDIISAIDELTRSGASPSPSYILGGLYMARIKRVLGTEKVPGDEKKSGGNINQFNDFQQRQYSQEDYSELERRKLGKL